MATVTLSVPGPKSVVDVMQDLLDLVTGVVQGKKVADLVVAELPKLVSQYGELQTILSDAKADIAGAEDVAALYTTAIVNTLLKKPVLVPSVQ